MESSSGGILWIFVDFCDFLWLGGGSGGGGRGLGFGVGICGVVVRSSEDFSTIGVLGH